MTVKATLAQFIDKANSIHGEYDYSKAVYVDSQTNLIITCKLHGDFLQRPAKHIGGQGCPICRYIKSGNSLKQSPNRYFSKVKEIHKDLYEYNEQDFDGLDSILTILCKRCNTSFQLKARHHSILEVGCSKCNHIEGGKKLRLDPDAFIQRCKEIHGDLYDYTNTEYTVGWEKISIFCNRCKKDFQQFPSFHLYSASGCQDCAKKTSKEEKEVVDFIKSFYKEEVIENTRKLIAPYELDIYIPEKSFAIEYNGLVWHTEEHVGKDTHAKKSNMCKAKDLQLFHIFSDEWRDKKEIVKSMIKYRLGLTSERIFARKCEFEILSKLDGKNFFEANHISGDSQAQVYFGLRYNSEIVCCLSLRKPIQSKYDNCIEICRFANKLNSSTLGGFQKLFERAKEYAAQSNFSNILTYADLRFGEGLVYKQAGFNYITKTALDYWYTDGYKREFRFKYRADSANGLTEKDVANNAGVKKIYGCGSNIWLLSLD